MNVKKMIAIGRLLVGVTAFAQDLKIKHGAIKGEVLS